MTEFIQILISFLFMSVADSIDTAFNNYLSINAVVVTGSFILIDTICKSFGEIGIYTYRTVRKNEWKYLWFNILFGLITGIIIFISKDIIVNIFDLTSVQKHMLSILLSFYVAYLVIGRLANGIFEITRLKSKLKLYRKSLIIFYVSLILLDTIAFIFTRNLTLLFVATLISWIISIIYMLYNLKLKFEYPDKESLTNVFKYGFAYSSERVLSRIFLLLYGVLASHLGTTNYSIHTICYSVCLTLEIITNAYQAALMIKVPEGKTYEKQYKNCMDMKKKCFPSVVGLNFLFAFIYLFISHGSVSIIDCFPYFLFYIVAVFGLYEYETYKTLCITQGKSYILIMGSIVGVILRCLICFIFIKSPYVLFIFGLANLIDFYSRGYVFKKVLYKLNRREKLV